MRNNLSELLRLACLGAAIEAMPQGVYLARHGALGSTKWCVTNVENEHDCVDGNNAYQALINARGVQRLSANTGVY